MTTLSVEDEEELCRRSALGSSLLAVNCERFTVNREPLAAPAYDGAPLAKRSPVVVLPSVGWNHSEHREHREER
jgi:hypothetical protein